MKLLFRFWLTAMVLFVAGRSLAQTEVYTADNGITASGTGTARKVSLGGNLTGNTGIGFNSFNLNFTGTGNIGIRTSSPQAPLHVFKNVGGNYNPVMILEDGLADGYVMFQMKGTGRLYHLGVGNASEPWFGLANKFFIWDQTAAAPRMVVDPNGNIGIGTVTPANRLSIASATAGTSGLQFTQLTNASAVVAGNGKVLSVDATGNVILVNDATAAAAPAWSLTGNAGTSVATHFIGTTDNTGLVFKTNNTDKMQLTAGGNIGIGTSFTPTEKLDVQGNVKATGLIIPTNAAAGKVLTSDANGNATWQDPAGGTNGWALGGNNVAAATKLGTTSSQDLLITTNDLTRILISANGTVGIGTTQINDDYKLFVEGSIRTRKVRVDPAVWPDYVFGKQYRLPPLAEVAQYIQKHRHLPDMPPAAEVEKNGLDLGDNQALLLKKIEELTLYIIDLDNKVERLSKENAGLKKRPAVNK